MSHDPGGKVKFPLLPGTVGDAVFSDDGVYRHWLMRDWAETHFSSWKNLIFILWIGMNPSTAEGNVDDPTIRKEIKFSKRLGHTRYVKCNVMDYRSTNPKLLPRVDAISSINRKTIRWFAKRANMIVCCWGKLPPLFQGTVDRIVYDLKAYDLWCLGTNGNGSPKHPLYLPDNTSLIRFTNPRGLL